MHFLHQYQGSRWCSLRGDAFWWRHRTLRVDRLVLLGNDGAVRRSHEDEHDRAMARLARLLHVCGGLCFG